MSCGNSKKSKGRFLRNKKKFIVELILKIYMLNLLIVLKIDILDFALGVYLV